MASFAGKDFRPLKVKVKRLTAADKIRGVSIRPGGYGLKLAKKVAAGIKL